MKDAIIQMLDRDLDEAEEQYQTALRSHLQNVDSFINLYRAKVRKLEEEFEQELSSLQVEFDTERWGWQRGGVENDGRAGRRSRRSTLRTAPRWRTS